MLTIKEIAQVAHEANRAYCAARGDNFHAPWGDTPLLIQNSVISGVEKLIDHPNTTPLEMHENWCQYKMREGWIPGPVKNLQTKEHPNLVPYKDLPLDEKMKDHLFYAIVTTLLAEI